MSATDVTWIEQTMLEEIEDAIRDGVPVLAMAQLREKYGVGDYRLRRAMANLREAGKLEWRRTNRSVIYTLGDGRSSISHIPPPRRAEPVVRIQAPAPPIPYRLEKRETDETRLAAINRRFVEKLHVLIFRMAAAERAASITTGGSL